MTETGLGRVESHFLPSPARRQEHPLIRFPAVGRSVEPCRAAAGADCAQYPKFRPPTQRIARTAAE
jgi:hypothetical protein